jgi:hypothetical protein
MDTINVGVSSWIIQDGNYDDFAVGETHVFALEFYAEEPLALRAEGVFEMVSSGADHYKVFGRVAFVAKNVWVIDTGVLMYRDEGPPSAARTGDHVAGEVFVGIDPFFYKEGLHAVPGMPPLNYTMIIESISLETTPWIKSTGITQRDGNRSFRAVGKTNAWRDDDGNADYVLHCRVVSGPAAYA